MPVPTIEWKNGNVRIIDQCVLPGTVRYITCRNERDIFSVIKRMNIRGAPALGVAGAFGMYVGIRHSHARTYRAFDAELKRVERYLASSRPTARNLFWGLERMAGVARAHKDRDVPTIKRLLLAEARAVLREDKEICRAIGAAGAPLVKNGTAILTHCNAGGLATADYGTALAVMFAAKELKRKFSVFVDETRPVLQGARLTAWELKRAGIRATLICDNMAASLMAQGAVSMVIVGADRIASNGDVANKIGTYGLAVLARAHRVPFYVAAPVSTFDFRIRTGKEIVIEERDPDEVRTVRGVFIAPKKMPVYNPAFDVTPRALVTGIITEKGIVRSPYARSISRLRRTPH